MERKGLERRALERRGLERRGLERRGWGKGLERRVHFTFSVSWRSAESNEINTQQFFLLFSLQVSSHLPFKIHLTPTYSISFPQPHSYPRISPTASWAASVWDPGF